MLELRLNLAATGVGSTTPYGALLPNIVLFSTSTITSLMGSTYWNLFQLLIAGAIWLGTIHHVYVFALGSHKHV